jgi:hypothetical protein
LAFRGVGALWAAGGALLVVQMIRLLQFARPLRDLERALEADGPGAKPLGTDVGRRWWMLAGGLLTAAAGAVMLLGLWISIPALCAVIAHQMLYFVRQRRRELAASSSAEEDDARPASSTINAFFFSLIVALVAAWLALEGRLN